MEAGSALTGLIHAESKSSQSRGPNHAGYLFSCLDWESPGGDGTQRYPRQILPRLLQNVIEPLRQFIELLRHSSLP
jgi:hypothetical protein